MSEVLEEEQKEHYTPSEDETKFLIRAYSDFQECLNIKGEGQEVLGGRSLQQFWDDSNRDFNVIVADVTDDDPVTPYASSVSRDKSNTFITNLTLALIYPSITAQNKDQDIDQTISRVSRSILEWQHDNDGRPAESGHEKMVRYVHKMVIEGTVHVQDDIDSDTGKLISQLVPNEEVFVPNFWQPNIQEQPYIFRVQDNVLYDEARSQFGELDNFKYVNKGPVENWAIDTDEFKSNFEGIIDEDRVQIVYVWYNIPKSKFKEYGIPKNRKRAKFFNILINGVPMFKIDNLMPYRDGFYPISKQVFELFSKSEFYWGNSMPNKAKYDKKWLDGWKTLIRHKAKLSVITPLLTFNGQLIDSDIFIPGSVNTAPAGMTKDDIIAVPGTDKGLSEADFRILQDAKNEINEGNLSPQASGAQSSRQQTAREAIIREQNEQQILGGFGLRVSFLIEARTYPILLRSFQFLPRKTIKKLVIPNQSLQGGFLGNLEVLFEKIQDTEENLKNRSLDLATEEIKAEHRGRAFNRIYIDPSYLNEIDLYIKVIADPQPKKTSALRRAEAREKFDVYGARPDLFNARAAARALVRANEDDESELIVTQQSLPQSASGGQQPPQGRGQKILNNAINQETANLGGLGV